MALSYLQEGQTNTGLRGSQQQFDMKQKSDKESLSPPLNNNNTSVSIFPRMGATAAAGLSMITPEQFLAASRTAALMAAGLPLHASLAAANNASLYNANPPVSLFNGWVSSTASSPPLQGPISPALSTKSITKKSAANNNNNIVSSTVDKMTRKGQTKRRGPKTKVDNLPMMISGTTPPSPPTSVSPEVVKDSRDKVFTCSVCSRSFGYKHVLQNHERTHTGEKPFECHVCHKRFTRDHHLKTHMRLHTGEKPYHCSHCDRQFVQVANLRRHLRVHTGERPYACETCNSKFSDSNQLKAHVLIHKGEKPFECEHCSIRFRRRHHLIHHKCGSVARSQCATTPSVASDDLEEDIDIDIDTEMKERPPLHHRPNSGIGSVPINLSSLPEQTEPEDLSMSTGMHRPHSHSHSSGESPLSRSPSSDILPEDEDDELDVSEASPSLLFLHRHSSIYQSDIKMEKPDAHIS